MITRSEQLLKELLKIDERTGRKSSIISLSTRKPSAERKSTDQSEIIANALHIEFRNYLGLEEFKNIGLSDEKPQLKLIPDNYVHLINLFRIFKIGNAKQRANYYKAALCLAIAAQIANLTSEQRLNIYKELSDLYKMGGPKLAKNSEKSQFYQNILLSEEKDGLKNIIKFESEINDIQLVSLIYYYREQYEKMRDKSKPSIADRKTTASFQALKDIRQAQEECENTMVLITPKIVLLCKIYVNRLFDKMLESASTPTKKLNMFLEAFQFLNFADGIQTIQDSKSLIILKRQIIEQGMYVIFKQSDNDTKLWEDLTWLKVCNECVLNLGNQQNFNPGDPELELFLIYCRKTDKVKYDIYLLAKCANPFKKTTMENKDTKFTEKELNKFTSIRQRMAFELKSVDEKASKLWETLAKQPNNPDAYFDLAIYYLHKQDNQTAIMMYKWIADGLIDVKPEVKAKAEFALAEISLMKCSESLDTVSAGSWPDQYAVQAMLNPNHDIRKQALALVKRCYELKGIEKIYPNKEKLSEIVDEWEKYDALLNNSMIDEEKLVKSMNDLNSSYLLASPAKQKPPIVDIFENIIPVHKEKLKKILAVKAKKQADREAKEKLERETKEKAEREAKLETKLEVKVDIEVKTDMSLAAGKLKTPSKPLFFDEQKHLIKTPTVSTLMLLNAIKNGADDIAKKPTYLDSIVTLNFKSRPVKQKTITTANEISNFIDSLIKKLKQEMASDKVDINKIKDIRTQALLLLQHMLYSANGFQKSDMKAAYKRILGDVQKHLIGAARKRDAFQSDFKREKLGDIFSSAGSEYGMPKTGKLFALELTRFVNEELRDVANGREILNKILEGITHHAPSQTQKRKLTI